MKEPLERTSKLRDSLRLKTSTAPSLIHGINPLPWLPASIFHRAKGRQEKLSLSAPSLAFSHTLFLSPPFVLPSHSLYRLLYLPFFYTYQSTILMFYLRFPSNATTSSLTLFCDSFHSISQTFLSPARPNPSLPFASKTQHLDYIPSSYPHPTTTPPPGPRCPPQSPAASTFLICCWVLTPSSPLPFPPLPSL